MAVLIDKRSQTRVAQAVGPAPDVSEVSHLLPTLSCDRQDHRGQDVLISTRCVLPWQLTDEIRMTARRKLLKWRLGRSPRGAGRPDGGAT